jgi:hypothetical protein
MLLLFSYITHLERVRPMDIKHELQQLRETTAQMRAEITALQEMIVRSGNMTEEGVQAATVSPSVYCGGDVVVPAASAADPEASGFAAISDGGPHETDTRIGSEPDARTSRRNLLRLLGASATGVVAATLVAPQTAAAAEGDAILIGRTTTNGPAGADTILNNSSLVANGPSGTEGVQGFSDGSVGYGVWGRSGAGYGVVGESSTGIDLATRGTGRMHLREHTFGGTYLQGEIARDASGSFWACIVAGTPGVWRKFASADSVGSTHFLANPVRFLSQPVNGRADAQIAGASAAGQSIPRAATGIFGVVFGQCSPLPSAWVTLFPTDGAANSGYLSATAVYSSSGYGGSSFSAKLSATGSLGIFTSSASQILIDIAGYYL